MKKYTVIKPEDYTKEHFAYIDKFKNSMGFLASQADIMFSLKDADFKGVVCSEISAKIFGFKSVSNFLGKHLEDYPCDGMAKYADQVTAQEQGLMDTCDINKNLEVLCVFEYCDGLKARVINKKLFHHEASSSILGVLGLATNVQLRDFINIVPTYILRFGALGSIESIRQNTEIQGVKLNKYEQEICFLFLLGWDFRQIAGFMDVFRPNDTPRTPDAIIKKKNYICHKLRLSSTNLKNLCDYLFSINFHTKMPESFYSRMIGTRILN